MKKGELEISTIHLIIINILFILPLLLLPQGPPGDGDGPLPCPHWQIENPTFKAPSTLKMASLIFFFNCGTSICLGGCNMVDLASVGSAESPLLSN